MFKRFREKLNKRIGKNKGATLIVVVVTISLLMLIGSVIGVMSFHTYTSSYGSLCRQQANYTAKNVLDGVVMEFKSNATFRNYITNMILAAEGDGEDMNKGIEIKIDINDLYDKALQSGSFNNVKALAQGATAFAEVNNNSTDVDSCVLTASYAEGKSNKIRLKVTARFKGFESSVSVVITRTNKAAEELAKIMSNTLYFKTPIVDMPLWQTVGDVYIDAPTVDAYDNIITKAGGETISGGHTLKKDLFGYVGEDDGSNAPPPNKWVEVYIRTYNWLKDPSLNENAVAMRGNLKCNTDVLLGLVDRGPWEHGFTQDVGYDGKYLGVGGQFARYTCLTIDGDVYVNGNIRAENIICRNIYAIDNNPEDDMDEDDNYISNNCKGNIVMEVKPTDRGAVTDQSYLEVQGNIVADGFVKINALRGGTINGNIYAGKYNEDGTKWEPEFYDTYADYVNRTGGRNTEPTILHAGDVILNDYNTAANGDGRITVYGDIFATGDVYIENARVMGNIYAGGKVTIIDTRSYPQFGEEQFVGDRSKMYGDTAGTTGNIYCGGDFYCDINLRMALNAGDDEWSILGSVYCGGNATFYGEYVGANNGGKKHILGNLYAKGNITLSNGAQVGFNGHDVTNKGSNVYCGGNLSINDHAGINSTNRNTFVFVGGNLFTDDIWLFEGFNGNGVARSERPSVFVEGDYDGNYDTRIYGNLYLMGAMKCSYPERDKGVELVTNGTDNLDRYFHGFVGESRIEAKTIWWWLHNGWRGWTWAKDANVPYIPTDLYTTINGTRKFNIARINTAKAKLDDLDNEIKSLTNNSYSVSVDQNRLEFYKDTVSAHIEEWSAPRHSDQPKKDGYGYIKYEYPLGADLQKFKTENKVYVIDSNICGLSNFILANDESLILDTTNKDLHIKVSGNITLWNNCNIIIKGSGMAFLYLDEMVNSQPPTITFGKNSKIGLSNEGGGLYIISNFDVTCVMNQNVTIRSFNYLPYGTLDVRNVGKATTYQGAFVIGRIDAGKAFDLGTDGGGAMRNASYIKYHREIPPLILDGDGNLNFGSGGGSGNINYGEIIWDIIAYE